MRHSGISAPGGLGLSYSYDGGLLTGEPSSGTVAGSVARTDDNNFRTSGLSVDGTNNLTVAYDPAKSPRYGGLQIAIRRMSTKRLRY